jgi:hypothetical protein
MREIKFRALLKADGRIYEVRSVDFLNKEATLWDKETAVNFEAGFDEIELMQYTGINDINGEEIYTDFLVEYFRGGIKKLGKIKLEDGRFVITRLCDKGVNYGALLGFNWWYPDDLFEISSEEASHLKVAGVKYDC